MFTFQDFEKASNKAAFCLNAISEHRTSVAFLIANDADLYDRQKNPTVEQTVATMYDLRGAKTVDFTANPHKVVSNFFRQLNVQRNSYLLGNGVTFMDEKTKNKLGQDFDGALKKLGYKALIHGVSFGFWNVDTLHVFPLTEFVPFWDENTGALMAGVRFWRLADDKPLQFVIYEIDGFSKYCKDNSGLVEVAAKRPYKERVSYSPAMGEEVVGGDNYSALPVIPLYGSDLRQSTLVGMSRTIDAYDLAMSGYSDEVIDFIGEYLIAKNAGGMTDEDLLRFRDRLKLIRMAAVDTDSGVGIDSITRTIQHDAKDALLDRLRSQLYSDFGGLDVVNISASAKTATEINAAYQPLDEMADDYEYQIIEFIRQLLNLIGVDDYPTFKRNRIANQMEQTQMVLQAATYLDEQTVLEKIPWLTPDEVQTVLERKDGEDIERFNAKDEQEQTVPPQNAEESPTEDAEQ